jgi:hypothetical protein
MTPLPDNKDWQRPPFEPGNKVAQTHGAFTPSIVEPLADELRETILTDPDSAYLRSPRFAKRLLSYCQTEARVMRIEAWVGQMSDEEAARSDKGQTSPLELLRKWKTTAANEANKLGLDPVSWARIRKDYAVTRRLDFATWASAKRASEGGDTPDAQMDLWDREAAERFGPLLQSISKPDTLDGEREA